MNNFGEGMRVNDFVYTGVNKYPTQDDAAQHLNRQ
jgi:hypothetical protein